MQDEEAELLAELERIKRERAEEAGRKAAADAAAAAAAEAAELARGNPLLQERLALQVRRRPPWVRPCAQPTHGSIPYYGGCPAPQLLVCLHSTAEQSNMYMRTACSWVFCHRAAPSHARRVRNAA